MADISRYPTVTSYSPSDQLITYQTSSGQLVKIPISVFSEALAQTFTALTDTPGTYVGQQGKTLAVNNTEDALEFVPNNLAPNFITLPDTPGTYGTAAGKTLRVNGAENAVEFVDSTFLNNTDTPASYAGQALNFLRVNAAETALEFTGSDAAISDVVIVNEESDLPAVNGSGEHELEAGTAYWFTGALTLSSPLRIISSTTTIYGNSSSQSIISYTGSGYAVRASANTVVQMRDIRIDSSADGIQMAAAGGVGSQDSVLLSNLAILAPSGRSLSIDNVDQFIVDGCFFLGAQGVELLGANNNLLSFNRSVFQILGTGNIIDFGTSIYGIAVVDACSLVGAAGAVAINGQASSANLTATGSGRITNNTVAQGVTGTAGITTEDLQWRFDGNVRIADSNVIAFAYISTPATTVITAPATVTPIAGTWTAAADTERATVSSAGVITFQNVEQEKGIVNVTFTAVKLGGGTGSYTFKVQKDTGSGYVDVEAITKTVTLSSTTASITLMGITQYVDGDDFRLVAVGNGTSDDIDVAVTQFVIGS